MAAKPFRPTKKGDDGTTTFNGQRISKLSCGIEMVGITDSLQSHVGDILFSLNSARSCIGSIIWPDYYDRLGSLTELFRWLLQEFYIISCHISSCSDYDCPDEDMDKILSEMPFTQYFNFILPEFNNEISVKLNIFRAIVRKAEIDFIALNEAVKSSNTSADGICKFLNRLSSVIYAALCYFNEPTRLKTIKMDKKS